MAKSDFVNTELYKIKDKLAAATGSDKTAETMEEPRSPAGNAPAAPPRNLLDKAMQTRLEELGKLKRDMQARYAEAAARCAVRRESLQTLLSETDQLGRTASVSLEELERLEPDSWTEQNYSSELAAGMRKLENLRLELIRRQARVAEMENSCGAGNAVAEKAGFGVAEMASLSFLQLFRIGFYMLLPLLMILFAGAVLIAAAAYFSTRI